MFFRLPGPEFRDVAFVVWAWGEGIDAMVSSDLLCAGWRPLQLAWFFRFGSLGGEIDGECFWEGWKKGT